MRPASDQVGKGMMGVTFTCGHAFVAENIGAKGICLECRRRWERANRTHRRQQEKATPPSLEAQWQSERRMAEGSQALLRALWRHHAPILRFAASKGRQVVKPDAA
jgi:hypothetical protein